MKKTVIALVLSLVCICAMLAGCSGSKPDSVYDLEANSGETFSVGIKTGKEYKSAQPTPSAFVILDTDNARAATVHMISRNAYDSYKTAASSLPSYKALKKNGMEGFSYTSSNSADGSEQVYARCYAVTDKTAIYVESSESDAVLDTVVNMLEIKQK